MTALNRLFALCTLKQSQTPDWTLPKETLSADVMECRRVPLEPHPLREHLPRLSSSLSGQKLLMLRTD
jgi:hypothetical protein